MNKEGLKMNRFKIIDMAQSAAINEIKMAGDYIKQVLNTRLSGEMPLQQVREDGHTAQVEIHLERAREWIEAAKEIAKMTAA